MLILSRFHGYFLRAYISGWVWQFSLKANQRSFEFGGQLLAGGEIPELFAKIGTEQDSPHSQQRIDLKAFFTPQLELLVLLKSLAIA